MFTNRQIYEIATAQSALESNCRPEDFMSDRNVIVPSSVTEGARAYLVQPLFCNLITYGMNVVASADRRLHGFLKRYVKHGAADCFSTPKLHLLDREVQKYGYKICFMAEYFLPDMDRLQLKACAYELKVMEPSDFRRYYGAKWTNAICYARRKRDVLAVGAFAGQKLVGLAGASADCDTMWQIGIDVAPAFRRQGIASALTSRLALEICERGKVPFYCAAWSNVRSVRNAISSGLRPAWVEMTAKPEQFVIQ